jgi:hypothetical protein
MADLHNQSARMVSLVRGMRLPGGVDVILVHDFMSVVYDMSPAMARAEWRALCARTNLARYMTYEVALNAEDAEDRTPAMTAEGLQRLQEMLGLDVADRFRVQRALVFERCIPHAERARRAM